jgi:hypothetical protein
LQQQTPVKDAVVFGSPGMDINNVGDLKVPAGHMFSERADQDGIPGLDIANHFGTSPYQVAGIERFETGIETGPDGQALAGVHQHSEYLTNNSTSQFNMAAVVAGRSNLAVPYQPPPNPPLAPTGSQAPLPPNPPSPPIPAPPGAVPNPPPDPSPPR